MTRLTFATWLDEDGNAKVEIDGEKLVDNLDPALAVRKVVLSVDIPEPKSQDINVQIPAEDIGQAKVTVNR